MNQYPTKKQILTQQPRFNKETIKLTKLWKTLALKNWKTDTNQTKHHKLKTLITTLSQTNNKTKPKTTTNTEYFYDPNKKTIHLNINNPSIISTLHELAHHLYGPNEIQACRWSIWLFKKCFPEQYKKLEWKNHLLTKKKHTTINAP